MIRVRNEDSIVDYQFIKENSIFISRICGEIEEKVPEMEEGSKTQKVGLENSMVKPRWKIRVRYFYG